MDKNDTQGILEARIRQMAEKSYSDNGFSIEDFDPATDREEEPTTGTAPKDKASKKHKKRKEETLAFEENPDTSHPISADEYEKRFFVNRTYDFRVSFSLNRATLDILRQILKDMDSRATLSSFVENILLDHLHTYRSLINDATADKPRKPTIPNI